MDVEMYQLLEVLVEDFSNGTINGEEIRCFHLIKRIIDGELSKENLNEEEKKNAQKQFELAESYFGMFGVEFQYKEKFLKYIK